MCIQRQLPYRFQREAEAARRDAAAFAEDKQRMEQELAYMRVIQSLNQFTFSVLGLIRGVNRQ